MTESSDLVAVVERLRDALSDSTAVIVDQKATILALEADNAALVEERDDEIRAAYIDGATAVHNEWLQGGDAPRGDPEFGEAASDYVANLAEHGGAEAEITGFLDSIAGERIVQ